MWTYQGVGKHSWLPGLWALNFLHTGHSSYLREAALPSSQRCSAPLLGLSYKGNGRKVGTAHLMSSWTGRMGLSQDGAQPGWLSWDATGQFLIATDKEPLLEGTAIHGSQPVHSLWSLTNRLQGGFLSNHLLGEFCQGSEWDKKIMQGHLGELSALKPTHQTITFPNLPCQVCILSVFTAAQAAWGCLLRGTCWSWSSVSRTIIFSIAKVHRALASPQGLSRHWALPICPKTTLQDGDMVLVPYFLDEGTTARGEEITCLKSLRSETVKA